MAVMNVFPQWLMYISVMNHYRMDHGILMVKVFINYLSKRYEPLPKIGMIKDPHVKNSVIVL